MAEVSQKSAPHFDSIRIDRKRDMLPMSLMYASIDPLPMPAPYSKITKGLPFSTSI